MGMPGAAIPDEDLWRRFWSKVDIGVGDECWEWRGTLTAKGNGQLTFKGRCLLAARVAFELAIGPIPKGIHVGHTCGRKTCMSPDHLSIEGPGTPAERLGRYAPEGLPDECWEWTGAVNHQGKEKGYGVMKVGGRKGRIIQVHRLAFELEYGPIPRGLFVVHSCDVRKCTNPAHLSLGTAANNTADMMSRGRQRFGKAKRGEENTATHLMEFDVRYIRAIAATGIVSQKGLAREHDVTQSAISAIVTRKAWGHLAVDNGQWELASDRWSSRTRRWGKHERENQRLAREALRRLARKAAPGPPANPC